MNNVLHSQGTTALNVCGCGKLHFTYGPITLHFEPQEFVAFAGSIAALLTQFRQIPEGRHPAPLTNHTDTLCH